MACPMEHVKEDHSLKKILPVMPGKRLAEKMVNCSENTVAITDEGGPSGL